MAENTENDEITGTISTQRHQRVRFRIGHDCGDVFGLDSDFDGISLTLEVADHADAQAMLDAITAPTTTANLLVAAKEVIDCASDTYKKRNGHIGSFQDDSGEKCWIVPFDAFEGLRTALAATEGSDND